MKSLSLLAGMTVVLLACKDELEGSILIRIESYTHKNTFEIVMLMQTKTGNMPKTKVQNLPSGDGEGSMGSAFKFPII